MITSRNKIRTHYGQWWDKELKRLELINECAIDIDCSTEGLCWDGSARANDATCSCPPFVAPECPEHDCENGVDDDCQCLPEPECECGCNAIPYDWNWSNTFAGTSTPEVPDYDNPLVAIWSNSHSKFEFEFACGDSTSAFNGDASQEGWVRDEVDSDLIASITVLNNEVDRGMFFSDADGN